MATVARPDLTTCDREPIHIPGSIQPHGVLLALEPDGRIGAASENAAEILDRSAAEAIGCPLAEVAPALATVLTDAIAEGLPATGVRPLALVTAAGGSYVAVGHRSGDRTILEFEAAANDAPVAPPIRFDGSNDLVAALVRDIQPPTPDAAAFQAVARTVRAITGFDRVLIYQFDEGYTGTVIGEDRNEALPSYLDLRFPASDIPAQARELYRISRVRQIPDAGYRPVPLVAGPTQDTIDLSLSTLRSVSPVHLEYMRNMGTAASMSVSVLYEGRLWGLIACHNRLPHRVPLTVRTTCDFIAQVLSMRIAAQAVHGDAADRVAVQAAQARLLAAMSEAPSFADGLVRDPASLLGTTRAAGAAVVHDGTVRRVGEVPDDVSLERILGWLQTRGEEVVVTERLAADMGATDLSGAASGLAAISLSRIHASWVLWFRPEVVRTVTWGGDPRKQFEPLGPDTRISPRKSFAAWKETVRGTSRAWTPAEIDAARGLRTAIVDIVLRRAEELAALSEDLRRSNKELEAFSYSISHDLRAPFRHIVGYAELLSERESKALDEKSRHYLRNIIEAAHTAGKLVDDLLHFAQMGRVRVQPVGVDMNKIVQEVCRSLTMEVGGRAVEWRVDPLPPTQGDPSLLRQVMFNLVSNAVKYTRGTTPAVIEIGGWTGESETTYFVRDNGIGFDMAYADKLFQVFQRLNRTEEFEGTGIGLAIVRRIVERHGGRAWASGQVGRGATFYIALPVAPPAPSKTT